MKGPRGQGAEGPRVEGSESHARLGSVLRRFGPIILALLSLSAAAFASGKIADRLGRTLAVELDETLGAGLRLARPPRAETREAAVALAPVETPPLQSVEPPRAPAAKASAPKRHSAPRRAAEPVPERGLRVSAKTVLRLAQSGARPGGTPVPASRGCPAGLRLSGVSGLGVGLRDGDVLTHAAGRPAKSRAEVVGAVIGARGALEREVSGRFCRDGEAWNLVVEQPYLDSSAKTEGRGPRESRESRGG